MSTHRLLLLGLNHTTAPLEIRERVAFDSDARAQALNAMREKFPRSEFVILSTCNRMEFYSARPVHGYPRPEQLLECIAQLRGVDPAALRPHMYEHADRAAMEHLFHVAASLDSMVLGETQILGQVRQAYEAASALSATGTLLNPLFQRAIAVGKQVMHETALGEGRLSVASVAVEYASQIFDQFTDKTVLSIGAGKMSQLVLRHFSALKPGRLLVCNRSIENAQPLAQKYNGSAVLYSALPDHLAQADVVITSTGAVDPIITRAMMEATMRARRFRTIVMVDLALPRDVESSVGAMDGVYLYNLDDLQRVVQQTQSTRQEAIDSARKIVLKHADEFDAWNRARDLGPLIERMYAHHHKLAQGELERTLNKLPHLSDADRAHLEDLARRIVNKMLHEPIRTLRSSDESHGPTAQYIHAMEKLFNLSSESDDTSDKP